MPEFTYAMQKKRRFETVEAAFFTEKTAVFSKCIYKRRFFV